MGSEDMLPNREWFAVSGQPHSSERYAAPPHTAWCSIAPSWHKAAHNGHTFTLASLLGLAGGSKRSLLTDCMIPSAKTWLTLRNLSVLFVCLL